MESHYGAVMSVIESITTPITPDIVAEIQRRFGFVPPFFKPAEQLPSVLRNLWQQTTSAYLDTPLPALFKDELFAHLSRCCHVPYGMLTHPAALQPLAMEPDALLAMMQEAPGDALLSSEIWRATLGSATTPLSSWPAPSTSVGNAILHYAVMLFCDDSTLYYRLTLQEVLGSQNYDYLIMLLSYIKTCHNWIEAHAEMMDDLEEKIVAEWPIAQRSSSPRLLDVLHRLAEQPQAVQVSAEPASSQLAAMLKPLLVELAETEATEHSSPGFTRQLALEAQARASLSEAIFDSLTDTVMFYDREGNIVRANFMGRGFTTIGLKESMSLKERWHNLPVYDEHGQAISFQQYPAHRILHGEVFVGANSIEIQVHLPDNGLAYYSITGAPVRDLQGKIIGGVSISRNITERRKLEQRTSEALHALLDMAETLVQFPADGSPSMAAQDSAASTSARVAGLRLVELTRHVLKCQRAGIASIESESEKLWPVAIVGPTPEHEQNLWRELEESYLQDQFDAEQVALLRRGECLTVQLNPDPLQPHVNGRRIMLVVPMISSDQLVGMLGLEYSNRNSDYLEDEIALAKGIARLATLVIERERLLCERAEARAHALALQATQERMNTFFSIASHELRTPITSILGFAEILHIKATTTRNFDESCVRALTFIEEQSGHLTHLIEELLDLARIENDQLPLHLDPHDLLARLTQIVESQTLIARDHPLHFVLEGLQPNDTLMCSFDEWRIEQVVNNLLSNAVKYSPAGSAIEIGLRYSASSPDEALLWVKDHGMGIAADELPFIFDRFHRSSKVYTSISGMGIGLYLVREFVTRHKGRVWAESQEGEGTTFYVALPLL